MWGKMKIYLDSSLVASLYTLDSDTAAATAAIQLASGELIVTPLCEIEVINALGLRAFRKEVPLDRTRISIDTFERDLRSGPFERKPLPAGIFPRAGQLSKMMTPQTGIRAADLLHIAAALELGTDAFYTFDRRQRTLADATGLTLNPLP